MHLAGSTMTGIYWTDKDQLLYEVSKAEAKMRKAEQESDGFANADHHTDQARHRTRVHGSWVNHRKGREPGTLLVTGLFAAQDLPHALVREAGSLRDGACARARLARGADCDLEVCTRDERPLGGTSYRADRLLAVEYDTVVSHAHRVPPTSGELSGEYQRPSGVMMRYPWRVSAAMSLAAVHEYSVLAGTGFVRCCRSMVCCWAVVMSRNIDHAGGFVKVSRRAHTPSRGAHKGDADTAQAVCRVERLAELNITQR